MAVALTFTVTPTTVASGGIVTGTYAVSGNTGTPAVPDSTLTGTASGDVGAEHFTANFAITKSGVPAVAPLTEVFSAPTSTGITWVSTADPKVWKGTVA